MRVTVSNDCGIALPEKLRKQDEIRDGDQFEIERIGCAHYRLRRVAKRKDWKLIDWLLACPVKGWFKPLEGESTDAITPTWKSAST
jgi:hypothetical protein